MGLVSKASVLDAVRGGFMVTEATVPEPAPGSIVVKQELCGVCGTDVHVYQGHMASVPMPVVLGHEIVGTIVALGDGVTVDSTDRPIKEGDLIGIKPGVSDPSDYYGSISYQPTLSRGMGAYGFAAKAMSHLPLEVTGGFAQYQWLIPGTKVYRMDGVSQAAASILEPLSVGIHAAGRARYRIGDTVVIQGAGPIGLMCLIAAKELGAFRTIVIGAPADRLAFARELGADLTIDITQVTDPADRAKIVRDASSHGFGADIIIEATGVLAALPEGFDLLRRGGQYVTCGHFTNVGDVSLNPWSHFTFKEITLYGVWGSSHEHFVQSRQLIESGKYPFEQFVSHVLPLEQVSEGIAAMSGRYTINDEPIRKVAIRAN
jgi:threonine dehydrogenase-like Zn-dependent dehydrogenase